MIARASSIPLESMALSSRGTLLRGFRTQSKESPSSNQRTKMIGTSNKTPSVILITIRAITLTIRELKTTTNSQILNSHCLRLSCIKTIHSNNTIHRPKSTTILNNNLPNNKPKLDTPSPLVASNRFINHIRDSKVNNRPSSQPNSQFQLINSQLRPK